MFHELVSNFTERTEPSTSKLQETKVVKELGKSEGNEPVTLKKKPRKDDPMKNANVAEICVQSVADTPPLSALKRSMPVKDNGGRIKRKYNLKKGHDEVHVLSGRPEKSPESVEEDYSSTSRAGSEISFELSFSSDSSNSSSQSREQLDSGSSFHDSGFEKSSIVSAQPRGKSVDEGCGASCSKDNLRNHDAALSDKVDTKFSLDKDDNSPTADTLNIEECDVPIDELPQQFKEDDENVPVNEVDEDDTPVTDPHRVADVSDDEDGITFRENPENLSKKSKMNALQEILGETSGVLQAELPMQAGPSDRSVGSNDEPETPKENSKKRRFVTSKETPFKGGKKKGRPASLPNPVTSGPTMPDQRRNARLPQSRFYVEGKCWFCKCWFCYFH